MKLLITLLLATFTNHVFSAPPVITLPIPKLLECNAIEVNSIYMPMLKEVLEWEDAAIYPYALKVCQLTHEKTKLQKLISNKSNQVVLNNWRVCKEVIPGNPNPSSSECRAAYGAKVNSQIDSCLSLVEIGQNPHNVALFIVPLTNEVNCLKSVESVIIPL